MTNTSEKYERTQQGNLLGIWLLFEGSMEEIKNPLSKVHKGSLGPKGSFPLDIFAHRGMEVAPLAETLCYEFEVSC